jgi:hypothetical protein
MKFMQLPPATGSETWTQRPSRRPWTRAVSAYSVSGMLRGQSVMAGDRIQSQPARCLSVKKSTQRAYTRLWWDSMQVLTLWQKKRMREKIHYTGQS